MLKYILAPINELKNILANLFIFWPDTPFGNRLRYRLYKRQLSSIGENVVIASGVRFGQPDTIEIGCNCEFGRNVNINAGNCRGVYIGNDVSIADGTYLRSGNHSFDRIDIPIQQQGHFSKSQMYNDREYSVIIEDDVWIGARVIILSGVKIGKGSVIGAGTVITNVIPPYSIVVGNPGRVISSRLKE
jgi:maltose O-acetyltransferase